MPLVKHDYPVLEYDTASKAVFQPGNVKKCFPAKAVFAFLDIFHTFVDKYNKLE